MRGAPDEARSRIAERAALEVRPGEVVNLGVGLPNLIPRFLPPEALAFLQTENGLLGVGPRPAPDAVVPDLIDAAKQPITAVPGAAYFDSVESFAMIRGGHVDVAMLGALQVAANGDLANWRVPGRLVLGVGGAMDLVVGAARVIVVMTARNPDGAPKLVEACTLPLTARAVVSRVITEHAVFDLRGGRASLVELLGDADVATALAGADCEVTVSVDAPR